MQGQAIVVGKTPRGPYLGAIFIGGLPAPFEYAGTDDLDAALSFTAEEALFVLVDLENARPGVLFASLPAVNDVPNGREVFAGLSVD